MSHIVRPATAGDAREMARIAARVDLTKELAGWIDRDTPFSAWHIVEDERGTMLGYQQIGAVGYLPSEACEIATFFAPDAAVGVGSRLFGTTVDAARSFGFSYIVAKIKRSNPQAGIYYQSRGFRVYHEEDDRIFMRYDLD